jgi:hypothetical protein
MSNHEDFFEDHSHLYNDTPEAKRSLAPFLIWIGSGGFLLFACFFGVGMYKVRTYEHGEARVIQWVPFIKQADESYKRITDQQAVEYVDVDQSLAYSPILELPLSNGDTVRFAGGGFYGKGSKSGYTKQKMIYKPGPPVEHLQYSVLMTYIVPFGLMFLMSLMIALGFKLRGAGLAAKPARKQHEPYHPAE